jgi:hypothetical protein
MDLLNTYTHDSELLNTSEITTAPAKSLPACCVFTSRSQATSSSSGDSSASRTQVLYSQPPVQKSLTASQSQSHIATDSQSVSLSWCRTLSGAYDQKFVYWV